MQPYKPQPKHRKLGQLLIAFPRKHLLVAGLATLILLIASLIPGNENQVAQRTSQPLAIEITPKTAIPAPTTIQTPLKEPLPWTEIKIGNGDNLSKIFQRAKLSSGDVYEIVSSSSQAKQLTKIYPGQKLAFQLDPHGKLFALKHIQDQLNTTLYERDANGFKVTHQKRKPEVRQRWQTTTITSSLYKAANSVGIGQDLIMELANVFGGVIDFVYDVRAGDKVNILFEERYLDGKKLGNGSILAAQFTNQGQTYNAFRYVDDSGRVGYYNEKGVSMRKAFLRAPLDFTRISSNFNPRRLHPIFKTSRPHRGIDYAAARGTPVYAAGDGRIQRAGYSKANGNYVIIKHGEQYMTKYLHLHKRAVKKGQKVKQQQIIGWVGSTGYATGPHLHYEFLVNGVHRNPRTILRKLPKAKAIAKANKAQFQTEISSLQMQLATYSNHHELATAEQLTGKTTL